MHVLTGCKYEKREMCAILKPACFQNQFSNLFLLLWGFGQRNRKAPYVSLWCATDISVQVWPLLIKALDGLFHNAQGFEKFIISDKMKPLYSAPNIVYVYIVFIWSSWYSNFFDVSKRIFSSKYLTLPMQLGQDNF